MTRTFPSQQLNARAALLTLGLLSGCIAVMSTFTRHGEEPVEVHVLIGLLRLSMALPVLVGTVGIAGYARALPPGLAFPFALTTASITLWLVVEGTSSLYGEAPYNDWLETGLNVLMTLGLAGVAFSVVREINRRRDHERQAKERDPLTGLLNRSGITRHYHALPKGTPVTVILADLNDLTSINQLGGHGAGDAHIQATGQALQAALPGQALIGRWGGDEFLVLLPGETEAQATRSMYAAEATAPRVRHSLASFAFGVMSTTSSEPLDRALALAGQRLAEQKFEHRELDANATGEPSTVTLDEFTKRLELLDTPDEVLEVGLGLVRVLLGFEATAYFERQQGTFMLSRFTGVGFADLATMKKLDERDPRPGLVDVAADTNSTVWSADYPSDPRAVFSWVDFGLKSVVMTPVRAGGEMTGVLAMGSFSTWRTVTPQVRRLLEAVALRLGHTLERLRVIEEVRATLEGGLLGMGLALEARDLETAGHTERVVCLAVNLGEAMGLRGTALSELKQGAYLHDIGKLSIPDAILLKPGRLDQEEWTLMQTHASRGHEIASRIPALSAGVLGVIRHHHERWDGQGYPDRLAGEEIPLLARIFAVCDVYDALVSERPYKRAWSHDEAIREITAQSGGQFDPRVVSVFVELHRTRTPLVLE